MGRAAGSLCRFTCTVCGAVELVPGGTTLFRCTQCKPAPTAQYLAHRAVAKAIAGGALLRPRGMACVDCSGLAVEYDHRDYSKPLQVEPVCRRCNLARGAAIGHSTNRGIAASATA